MSDAQKVQISDSFSFGFWAGFGAFCAIGWMIIVGGVIDWAKDKLSAHKAHYVISVQSRQLETSDEIYVTEDYTRKLSRQIVFTDCDSASQITLKPGNYKIEISTITDKSTAKTCKVQ
jgi:hypothetical protein